MSLDKLSELNAGLVLQAKESGKAAPARAEQLRKVFDVQMRMARSVLGGNSDPGQKDKLGGFDSSLMTDALMMDALSTINRLMRSEAGLPRAPMSRQSANVPAMASPKAAAAAKAYQAVGALSAQFESGRSGTSAIGYDRVGGTSYGTYQIASKVGTMDRFLDFLDEKAPAWAGRLRNAGPADTGSKQGAMPEVWKKIASENPERFEELQHAFVRKENYLPARDMILEQTGLDFENAPPALREVLWSTSVQHGPTGAARIFNKVVDTFLGGEQKAEFSEDLIKGVYQTRKGQFGSSTERVRNAVANRLDREQNLALAMFRDTSVNRLV